MTDAPKIKPCPFCGGEMEDRGYGAIHAGGEGCPLQELAFDPVKWNTRHTPPEVQALVDALQPFARSGVLFPEPPRTVQYDLCIYAPAAGSEYSLHGDDLRTARAAITNWEAMTK